MSALCSLVLAWQIEWQTNDLPFDFPRFQIPSFFAFIFEGENSLVVFESCYLSRWTARYERAACLFKIHPRLFKIGIGLPSFHSICGIFLSRWTARYEPCGLFIRNPSMFIQNRDWLAPPFCRRKSLRQVIAGFLLHFTHTAPRREARARHLDLQSSSLLPPSSRRRATHPRARCPSAAGRR